ncbi:MAG: DNA translocase FtsK 4TM domain-containing protein [Clostridia bacterium]|nr:DNA translocase FtsK 4TM domain-containing protein [Clostridia bacterium]
MGRKKSKGKSKKQVKTIGNDMLGGFLVVFGLIYFVFLTFHNMGGIAEFVKNISYGLFGNAIYLFPITLIVVGCYAIASDKKIKISRQLLKGVLVMSLVSPIIYSFTATNFNLFSNFVKYCVESYNLGIAGAEGAIIAGLLVKLMGVLATRIVLIAITFITTLCVFNLSFSQFFKAIYTGTIFIGEKIAYICSILFRKDEEEENAYEEEPKVSRKERRLAMKQSEKMIEKGSPNVQENIKANNTEQVEFDFNKLGGKPSEQDVQAKQQRDEFFKKQKEQKEDKDVKEVLTLDHTKHIEIDNYQFPPLTLLGKQKEGEVFDKKAIHATAVKLQKTLASFGVEAKVTNITKGPTVTRYELTPNTGVKVSKIVNLSDDIALNLAAKSIRIEAPIPGKAAVGIEVPNEVSESVMLRQVIETDAFKDHSSKLAFGLGKDAAGDIVVGDIAKMPHVLVAGATGSGKSVCINSLIVSVLYKSKPSEVKMILIDPKMVELSGYNGIPHLLIPVVTDPKKAAGALNWAVQEMVNRYSLFASKGVKDIKGYNKIIEKEEGAKLPQIMIIIDELADLMMVAPNDVEDAICRLAQMARAAGMHLVIATQRPSVDVITGIIKANIPSRIAFTVSSQVDSRTILDSAGAEKLLGKGDMLYFPVGEIKPVRVQGAFISENEIEKIVNNIKENCDVTYHEDIIESIEKANDKTGKAGNSDSDEGDDADPILNDAIDLVVDMGSASASMLQRRFKIGYSRAGRIVDQMEARGLISGYEGSKPRQVLVSKGEWQEIKLGATNVANGNTDDSMSDSDDGLDSTSELKSKYNIEL